MERINSFKIAFSSVLTTLFMTTGILLEDTIRNMMKSNYQLPGKGWYLLAIALVSIFAVKILENTFVSKLLSLVWFRRLIMGQFFLEGYWLYKHEKSDKETIGDSFFYFDALAELRYDPDSESLKMNVFRSISEEKYFISDSNAIIFNEKDYRYFNNFKYIDKSGTKEGYATGYYVKPTEHDVVSEYDGIISVTSDDNKPIIIRQKGYKIDEKELKDFRKNQPKNSNIWRRELLLSKASNKENKSG
jgi:hypothetical protein